MDNLKRKIIEYIQEYNIATSAFEKKAGVGNAVVNRILDDKVKNPGIETILKIADVLNCSLDELFNRNQSFKKHILNIDTELPYNNELFRSICLYTVHFIELYRINHLTLQQVGLVIEEIYKHCLDRKLSLIDTKFADWFLKDHLLNRC